MTPRAGHGIGSIESHATGAKTVITTAGGSHSWRTVRSLAVKLSLSRPTRHSVLGYCWATVQTTPSTAEHLELLGCVQLLVHATHLVYQSLEVQKGRPIAHETDMPKKRNSIEGQKTRSRLLRQSCLDMLGLVSTLEPAHDSLNFLMETGVGKGNALPIDRLQRSDLRSPGYSMWLMSSCGSPRARPDRAMV